MKFEYPQSEIVASRAYRRDEDPNHAYAILDKHLKSSCQVAVFEGSVGSNPFLAILCRRFHDKGGPSVCNGVVAVC